MTEQNIIKTEDGAIVRKVFVTNIDRRATKKELLFLFEIFGHVHDVFIKTSDSTVGTRINVTFGFVTFIDPTSAYNAINYKKPIMLKHRRLKVRPADTWHQPALLENGKLNYDIGVNAIESSLPLRKEQYTGAIKKDYQKASTSAAGSSSTAHYESDQSVETMVTSNINILNDDCLTQLFSYFTLFELIALEEVCVRWHDIIGEMWQRIHHLSTDDLVSQYKSKKLTTDALRRVLVRCGKYLTSLTISPDKHSFNSRIHQVISKSCPHLQTLHLSGISSNSTGVLALSRGCKELRTLLFKHIPGVQDHVLGTLFRQNSNLKYIHIEGGSAITGKCLRLLPSDLQALYLINCNSLQSGELRAAFRNMKNLKSLMIESCMTLTSSFVSDVADSFPNLESFSLNKYYPLMNYTSLKPIIKMTNLTMLSFSMNTLVSDNLLDELSRKCINVESLDLSSCCKCFTAEGLYHLAKFPKLSKIYLNYVEVVTGESLGPLANEGNLIHIELRGCVNLTDSGPIKVFEKCKKLECMDLSECDMISIGVLAYAFDMIKSKNSSQKLKLIIGGSGILDEELDEDIETASLKERFAHANLEISYDNLCEKHLRPDFFDDYFPDSDDDLDMLNMDYDDYDDFENEEFNFFDHNFHYFAAGAFFEDLIGDFLSDDDYF
uniref:Putative rna-binding protein n=1 Tax=Xenopsylla cheopis TaxID=163159 RepID=A0A6M2DJL8_XENCH